MCLTGVALIFDRSIRVYYIISVHNVRATIVPHIWEYIFLIYYSSYIVRTHLGSIQQCTNKICTPTVSVYISLVYYRAPVAEYISGQPMLE